MELYSQFRPFVHPMFGWKSWLPSSSPFLRAKSWGLGRYTSHVVSQMVEILHELGCLHIYVVFDTYIYKYIQPVVNNEINHQPLTTGCRWKPLDFSSQFPSTLLQVLGSSHVASRVLWASHLGSSGWVWCLLESKVGEWGAVKGLSHGKWHGKLHMFES